MSCICEIRPHYFESHFLQNQVECVDAVPRILSVLFLLHFLPVLRLGGERSFGRVNRPITVSFLAANAHQSTAEISVTTACQK